MLWIFIFPLVIVAIAIIALLIFFAVKFFKWLFTPLNTGNAKAQNADEMSRSEQFRRFSSERVAYYNSVIKQQKAAGTFDEGKKVYEEGEYMGVKYSIVKSSAVDMEGPYTEEDLMVQMIIFTQVHD
ncbi:MAG: hypothetical protein JW997_01190 [Actinobacteria bacterium]|nr:hypothetical protein [Actinomycetota bacterium]